MKRTPVSTGKGIVNLGGELTTTNPPITASTAVVGGKSVRLTNPPTVPHYSLLCVRPPARKYSVTREGARGSAGVFVA